MKYWAILTVLSMMALLGCRDTEDLHRTVTQQLKFVDFDNHRIESGQTIAKIRKIVRFESSDSIISRLPIVFGLNDTCIYFYNGSRRALIKYDLDGRFRQSVASYGKGPGEVLDIRSIDIGPKGICALDALAKKIVVYDEDLRIKTSYIPEVSTSAAIWSNSGNIVLYTPYLTSDSLLVFVDLENGGHIKRIVKSDCYKNINFMPRTVFSRNQSGLFFLDYLKSDVYHIDSGNKIRLHCHVKLADQMPTKCLAEQEFFKALENHSMILGYFETANHRFIQIIEASMGSNTIIQDKESLNWVLSDKHENKNDYVKILPFLATGRYNSELLYTFVSKDYLINVLQVNQVSLPPDLAELDNGDIAMVLFSVDNF